MMMIVHKSSPQSACSEPAVFYTGLGLPGSCNRVQPAQLSALPQPKIGKTEGKRGGGGGGGHEVDAKGYKPQKILRVVRVSRTRGLFPEARSRRLWHS